MCTSEMSVVLQFLVHKLTWLKIVQNIQSMGEGETAFLKKEGLDFINLKKLLMPSALHSPQEALNNRDGGQASASPAHLGSFRTGGVGAGRGVALTSLRPRTSSRALACDPEGTVLPNCPPAQRASFPAILTRAPDLGQRPWV